MTQLLDVHLIVGSFALRDAVFFILRTFTSKMFLVMKCIISRQALKSKNLDRT